MRARVIFYGASEATAVPADMVESSLIPGRFLVGGGHA